MRHHKKILGGGAVVGLLTAGALLLIQDAEEAAIAVVEEKVGITEAIDLRQLELLVRQIDVRLAYVEAAMAEGEN